MSYRFIYSQSEALRVIPAVIIDKRASIPQILGQIGSVIKQYTDAIVSQITPQTLFYKIETVDGNLAGYFYVYFEDGNPNEPVWVKVLRPPFVQFDSTISSEISSFMISGAWQYDYL